MIETTKFPQNTIATLRWLLFFICLSLFITSCVESVSTPFTSQLLFEKSTNDGFQIYRANPDGSHIELITNFGQANLYWLSPNGKYLALLSRFNEDDVPAKTLRVIEMASNQEITRIPDIRHPAFSESYPVQENLVWSPLGDKFVFLKASDEGEGINLWLYDLATNTLSQLTKGESIDRAPAWSPDGQKIAYATLKACGNSPWNCASSSETANNLFWDIVIISLDTGEQQFITDFEKSNLLEADAYLTMFCNLKWSPDNQYIAFENQCGSENFHTVGREVFISNTSSNHLFPAMRQAILSRDQSTMMSFYSFDWLPDNQLAIGYSKLPENYIGKDQEIYGGFIIAAPPTFEYVYEHQFTNESLGLAAFSFSNEGTHLIWFGEMYTFDNELMQGKWLPLSTSIGNIINDQFFQLKFDGNVSLPLGTECYLCEKVWSPDGSYVAYITSEENDELNPDCIHGIEKICDIAIVSPIEGLLAVIESEPGKKIRPIAWIEK